MKLVSGIVDSGFFAQSALSAEVATKDSLGRNISETYLTAVDIPESAVWNATTQTVSANSAQWAGGTANPQIPVTGINGIKISESGDQVVFEVSADYATEDWVTGQGYLTAETDWTNTITAASANAYNEATAAIPTGLATTGDLQTVSGEITALIPSTAGLATEDWVTAQGYLTTAYTPEFAYHDSAISAIDESAIYDTSAHARINTLAGRINTLSSDKADVTALSDYQTTAGMTAYLTTGDSAEFMTTAERSDYIPTGVSSEFYTTANESGYITGVPNTYLQNTDLSTEDGKVTAISGIPLSAGGDVPEGVMVESGLEYNAVNEISGYNGSAIAQYGAEKQWLVHDDTLVHLSNSAQYALGVNLSAVAQLLGIDETLLWSGDINENNLTGSLSEPISSFNKVKILTKINRSTPDAKQWFEFDTDREYYTMLGGLTDGSNTSAGGPFDGLVMISLTGGNVKYVNGYQHYWNSTAAEHRMFASIYKVIGIGRKEV